MPLAELWTSPSAVAVTVEIDRISGHPGGLRLRTTRVA